MDFQKLKRKMSLPVLPLLLKRIVRDRIIIKIQDIKANLDWSHFDISINAADLDLSTLIYDDVIEQLKIFENIAKLSIDLWRDHDYYRQFCFDMGYDNHEYRERLESLGCVCVDGKWKSVRRPSDDIVQMNVFKYCLYRQIYDEMKRHQGFDSGIDVEGDPLGSKKETGQKGDIITRKSVRIKDDALKRCGLSCEELENYEECSIENSCANDVCGTCKTNNDCDKCVFLDDGSVEICEDCKAMIKRNEGHIAVDRWKCGKCGSSQSYDCTRCDVCGDSRMMRGLWMCAKCTFINQCNNDVCLACGDCNEQLMSYCEYCEKNKVRMNEGRCGDCARIYRVRESAVKWKCWYFNCEEMNMAEDEYCCKCQLWRHNTHNRGDTVYRWCDGREVEVWVCGKCYYTNPLSRSVCIRYGCGHARYDKIWCYRCLWRTNGTTKYCEKHRSRSTFV